MSYVLSVNRASFLAFLALFFMTSLEAYSLARVPFQWISQLGIIGLCIWVLIRRSVIVFPGFIPFILLFTWSLSVTLVNVVLGDYASLMGSRATTNYEVYIFLRLLNLMSFFSVIIVVYWLCQKGYKNSIAEALINLGFLLSLYGFYIYIAQVFGLPEPPRTRVGTSGAEQGTTFSYAFHRAMGSFREPSHFAEWLVLPFFLSYIKGRYISFKTLTMGGLLLLTGSLTGILGVLGGFVASIFLGFQVKRKIREVLRLFIPLLGAMVLFSLMMAVTSSGGVDLVSVLWDRIEPMIEGGASESNRSYVYDYLEKKDPPFLGQGLGNSNLVFGSFLGLEVTASFLSLFISFFYSTGYVGMFFLFLFLVFPIWKHFYLNRGVAKSDFIFILSAYLAWLIMFSIHAEEFSFSFGVCYALVIYSVTFYSHKKRRTE